MEDAHAAVLDLQPEGMSTQEAASADKRISFFGVYDGHGGDKVAIYAGDNLHKIIAKQEAWKSGDMERAIKDGFLAADRAILSGMITLGLYRLDDMLTPGARSKIRGRSLRLHSFRRRRDDGQNLCRQRWRLENSSRDQGEGETALL